MLQVGLPAEFHVEYNTQSMRRMAWVHGSGGQGEGAGAVLLRPCFGESGWYISLSSVLIKDVD